MDVIGTFCLQKRDIISFPVEIATIQGKLAVHGERIHPIQLDRVKGVSDPQGRGISFWNKRTATAYGFPLGKPLSRSGGRIVDYIQPTGQLAIKRDCEVYVTNEKSFALLIDAMSCICS